MIFFPLRLSTTVGLLSVVIVPPGIDLAGVRDCKTVEGSHCHMNDLLPPQALHHRWLPHVLVGTVAKPVVVSFTPRPHQARFGQSQAKLGPTFYLDYPNTIQLFHVCRNG